MIPLTLPEIAAAVDGAVHDDADGVTVRGPAFQDTRAPEPDGLYVAFVGAHVDGHDLAPDAVAAGAAAVLASRPVGVPAVVVDDVQAALGALARHVLDRLPDTTVIAVTGSQGKTSTKDLLAAVLSSAAPTVATRGSFNNEIGLPLTVLRADPGTRFLLLEMGARGAGHLTALCQVAPPDVSLVLNVGKAHLGEFGSQAGIAAAKGELVAALADDGVAVLNADDPLVAAMSGRTRARTVTFGTAPHADVRIEDVRLDDQGRPAMILTRGGEAVPVTLRLVGEHHARNAAAAAAVATAVGIPFGDACRALAGVESLSRWRMEVHRRDDGLTLVNDAYNANPDSMEAALKALVAIGRGRGEDVRTVAVLGEMRELGESSAAEHEAVGRLAVRLGVRQLVVVGDAARAVHRGALREGAQEEDAVLVADNDEAVRWLDAHTGAGDVVLVKASRGARLDLVADALLRTAGTGEPR